MNIIVIYIGQSSEENLRHGLSNKIWGFKEKSVKNLKNYSDKDTYVLIATGFTGGSPRKKEHEWVKHNVSNVYFAKVTTNIYKSYDPEWPDEAGMSEEDRYIWRFRFDNIQEFYDVPLRELNNSIAEALRKSAILQSSGQLVSDISADKLGLDNIETNNDYNINNNIKKTPPNDLIDCIPSPKPFILLAGISGTGKTLFVRKQASIHERHVVSESNYCIIPVRPDWHEPADLLGYISRISGSPRYVTTDFLRFIVRAWQDCFDNNGDMKKPDYMIPHWLCLDEMNLAPVEQYFADFLSVLETRRWKGSSYDCDPIVPSTQLKQLDKSSQEDLRYALGLKDTEKDEMLWVWFLEDGITIPLNLIVVGTVNMDETTHGFSRKVIDRALTIDFGEFFPNDFQTFFEQNTKPVPIGISSVFQADQSKLLNVPVDPDGSKTIDFLMSINSVLKGTPFELAYRALNEALLSVTCFAPADKTELLAVWDDYLMMKVLPRIEGDEDKLRSGNDENLLELLKEVLQRHLSDIWDSERVDLLRQKTDGSKLMVECRSKRKLDWMQQRLELSSFTSYWP